MIQEHAELTASGLPAQFSRYCGIEVGSALRVVVYVAQNLLAFALNLRSSSSRRQLSCWQSSGVGAGAALEMLEEEVELVDVEVVLELKLVLVGVTRHEHAEDTALGSPAQFSRYLGIEFGSEFTVVVYIAQNLLARELKR